MKTALAKFKHNMANTHHFSLGKSMYWLGSAQLFGRIVRLGSSVIIARLLIPEAFGQVAIILTTFEILCTPTRRITSAALINMDDDTLAQQLTSANYANWTVCLIAFSIMCGLSIPIAWYYQTSSLVAPMIVMATSYLLLPLGMQYATLNLRANKMRIIGRSILWQTILDGILCAALALMGFGIWSIVIPKVLVIFVWIAIHRANNPLPEHSAFPFCRHKCQQLLQFGAQVGMSDVSIALRQNVDYLLVGYFLGVEALGVYFFAVNASLGISLGIAQSFGTALYTHLCQRQSNQEQQDKLTKYRQSLLTIMAITTPMILVQASLSPFYVPLVYGEQWINAGALPIFVLLCLSGLVRPLGEAASQLLLSVQQGKLNLQCNLSFTCLLVVTISLTSQLGLMYVALGLLLSYLIAMPLFCIFAYRKVQLELTASQRQDQHLHQQATGNCSS